MLAKTLAGHLDKQNMEKYSRQLLQNIYINLPQKLKEAIFSVDNAEKIYQISQRYQIPTEKVSHLAKVTGHVLLSILEMEKFISSVQSNLKINRNIAENIGRDIKQEIFQPVMDILIKIQQETAQKPISKSIPPKAPISPKPKDERIVDLKNLPNQ